VQKNAFRYTASTNWTDCRSQCTSEARTTMPYHQRLQRAGRGRREC